MRKSKSIVFILLISSILLFFVGCSEQPKKISQEEYGYDDKGRLISRITPDGSKIKYKYNNQGLPVEINYPDGAVRYGYDANGNRVWMQNKSGKAEYKYDAFGRLTEVIFKYSPEKRVMYEYDPWDRISAVKILDGQRVSYGVKYEYNILGNITSIDDGAGRIEYSYHPEKGEIIRKLPNGIKTIFSFSPSRELTELKHLNPQNELIASYRYEYYPPGKISRVFEETPDGLKTTKYEWDNRGYVKALHLPAGDSVRFEYDAMGNRISKTDSKGTITYKYDNFGKLLQAGDVKYEWDRNGNLIARIEKNAKSTVRYDSRNLPVLAKTPEGTTRYSYDADGNMIDRWKGKEPTYFLPDPLAPPGFTLAEFDKTGKLTSSYLYGDALLGQRDINGNIKYFLEDGFSSIRHVVNMSGKLVAQMDYTPFGEGVLTKGNIIPDFRMAGERFSRELKLYFVGNRLYNPSLGRYLTADPFPGYMERPDSFNKYAHGCGIPGIFMEPRCNQTHKTREDEVRKMAEEFHPWKLPIPFSSNLSPNTIVPLFPGQNIPFTYEWTNPEDSWRLFDPSCVWMSPQPSLPAANPAEGLAGSIQLIRDALQGLANFKQDPRVNLRRALQDYADKVARRLIEKGELPRAIMPVHVLKDPLGKITITPYSKESIYSPGSKLAAINLYVGYRSSEEAKREPKNLELREDPFAKRRRRTEGDIKKPFKGPDKCPGCPDDGGGGGGPGKPFGRGGPFNDPFKSIEAKLGGIELGVAAQFTGNLGNIRGAVYDPEKQVLVLVGDETASISCIRPEDLAVAMMCVFGPTPQDPQFSLDPADRNNPRGEWLRAVYIPEQIIGGTEFGKALFEADWLLKQYSFGVHIDENGRSHERKSSVGGFKSVADLSLEEKNLKQWREQWARFWIVSDDMKIKQSGKSIYFDSAKMRVKTKKQVPDPKSPTGLRDVDSEDDPIATKFAKGFTDLYDQIAKESPEFERVRQLGKAVAIAKWMKQEGIPFDVNWVNEYANKRIKTVGQITALSTHWEKKRETPFQRGDQVGIRIMTQKLHLFGGVDLTVKPKYVADDGTAQLLQKSAEGKLKGKIVEPIFDIKLNEKGYKAVVLPVTRNGQELWKSSPITTVGGTKYELDNQGQVAKSIDNEGNVTEYVWEANRRLNEFKTSTKNGWVIFGSRKNGYSEMTFTNPLKNTFLYRYSPSGYLNEILVNGQRYAAVDYREGDVTVNYGNFVERAKFDNQGQLSRYEAYSSLKGTPSGRLQALDLTYDKNNNITRIETPEGESIKFTYTGKNIETLSSRQGRVDYSYDAGGSRINHIDTSWGESIKYDYEGDNLTGVNYQNGDYYKNTILKNGLAVKEKNADGGSVEYKYTSNGLLEQVVDPKGSSGNYIYDNQGRLSQINLPDGLSINFQYEWGTEKDTKAPILKRAKVFYTISKLSSSPLSKTSQPEKFKEISGTLARRIDDIKEANRSLKNGLILDLFVQEKNVVHGNIMDPAGNIHKVDDQTANELRRLVNITAKTHGKLGREILDRWEKFYKTQLASLAKVSTWDCPDGKRVKLKPILIIKSNEVNYKYANLEKVPVLSDNFIIFIASKSQEKERVSETLAKDLVNKINNIPKLSQTNVAFIIRLPEMSKDEQSKWYKEIDTLQRLIGKNNVLVDPSKREFDNMLRNRDKDIIAIELTHTGRGILLKNGERYTSQDIKEGGDLSHIKYLISGMGTCNLPHLESGKVAASLREKGVGIINGSHKEVSNEVALQKLRDFINLLEKIKEYDLYPYQLIDIIDQRLGIPGEGTINLGKRDLHRDYFIG